MPNWVNGIPFQDADNHDFREVVAISFPTRWLDSTNQNPRKQFAFDSLISATHAE
jgi:hypothetical protein